MSKGRHVPAEVEWWDRLFLLSRWSVNLGEPGKRWQSRNLQSPKII